ncbi:MAG: restriction endonuclease subunit S [Burkholderiaceae bacterium]|nr:restriction endonuclease subunit S [Burkholderiaceae bacterium]
MSLGMAGEWREVALGDLFKVKHGFAFKGEFFTDEPQPEVLVTPGNFAIGGGFQDDKRKYYRGPVPTDYVLQPGQVVVTMTDLSKQSDTLGFAARVPNDTNVWLHNQRVGLLVFNPSTEADARFVEYLLRSHEYRAWVVGSATGTTVKHTSPSRIEGFRTLVPPPDQQRAIAHILGTLDDKIELNRRRNQTLEAMARALFKDWFVDFGPVRAKMEARAPYLPADLWQLFPDRLDDEGKPEGWEIGGLGDVAEHPRRSIQPANIEPNTPYIALEHMPKRCIALSDWGTADSLESNKYEFRQGEILFGKLRPYFHKVGIAPVSGVCSTDIVVVTAKQERWFGFLLYHVSSDEFVEYTNAGSTGTKMPRTSWNEMARYSLVLPPEALARAFSEIVRPWVSQIVGGIHESRTLAQLRDTLLPKLISGELRIKDADKFTGAVA